MHPRMKREADTVAAMIRLYCKDQKHLPENGSGLCGDCARLAAYADLRLAKCPFQEGKTTCAQCPVHCYKPEMRAQIRVVMRAAGPKMLLRHPVMTVRHLLDGRRKEPVKKKAR